MIQTPQHAIYFDRDKNRIDGVLTLQIIVNKRAVKVFDKLPARSGQVGFTEQDWVDGKSPTPFGAMFMKTKSVPLQMEPRNTPFFELCTDTRRPGVITNGRDDRVACGLHFENDYPGTAGCVALVIDTRQQLAEAWALFHYVESLSPIVPFIPFYVV
jgi:hypothetical protein